VTAERVTESGNIKYGDLVRIKGEQGATFKVIWVDKHDSARPDEVTVIGGSHGKSAWRTFLIDRVVRKPKKQQVSREEK